MLLARKSLTVGTLPRYRNPYLVYALGVGTLGLYFVWWIVAVNRELRAFDARIGGQARCCRWPFLITLGAPLGVPQFLAVEHTAARIERLPRPPPACRVPATRRPAC